MKENHVCGLPDSNCDTECMESAYSAELQRLRAELAQEKAAHAKTFAAYQWLTEERVKRHASHLDAFLGIALPRIGQLMESDPGDSTPDGRELSLLAQLAELYERQKYPEFSGRPVRPHRSGGGAPSLPEPPIELRCQGCGQVLPRPAVKTTTRRLCKVDALPCNLKERCEECPDLDENARRMP